MKKHTRLPAPWRAGGATVALLSLGALYGQAPAQAAPVAAEVAPPAPAIGEALDELVVDLDDSLSEAQVGALEARYGASFLPVSAQVTRDRMYRVRVHGGEAQKPALLLRLLAALRREPQVEAADLALVYQIPETAPTALTRSADEALPLPGGDVAGAGAQRDGRKVVPNDPKYKFQWHMDQIRMPAAWASSQGEGVVVAVIDTGVTKVEDLAGTELVPGYNFVDNNDDARDDHGHGTHVAGTIAQTTHNGLGVAGVAYKAKIMPIKVLSANGSGSVGGIAEGIRWAADHGAKVINMSLGGRFNSQVLAKAVSYAHSKGVVVVCAAGNDGRGKVSFPAANAGAIAVAATQFDETTTFYSNWGPEIAVAAPGGNTRMDQNGDGVPDGVMQNTVVPGDVSRQDYLLFMGTSMASPHVAGVAALLVGSGVTKPDAVAQILRETARRPAQDGAKGKVKRDDRYGAGIVDAAAAVERAQSGRGHEQVALTAALGGLLLLGLRRSRAGLGVAGGLLALGWAGGLSLLPRAALPTLGLATMGGPSLLGGVLGHGNPLVYSALLPIVLTLLGYGSKRLRGALAGLLLGQAAVLGYTLFGASTALLWLPSWLAAPWLLLNAALCLGLAALVARKD